MNNTPPKMTNNDERIHQNKNGEYSGHQNLHDDDIHHDSLMVSILEAVELTGLSESTIRRRIKHKKIMAWQVSTLRGVEWHIPLTEIERLRAEKAEKSIVKQTMPGAIEIKEFQNIMINTIKQALEQGNTPLKDELIGLKRELQEARKQIEELQEDLKREREKSFWRRIFGR